MFVKYERSLKTILNYYYSTSKRTMNSGTFEIPRYKIDYLAAKGLLEITPYVNEVSNCRIKISDKGLLYFDEKNEKLFHFWIPVIISIMALFRPEITMFIQSFLTSKTTP